MKRFLAEQSGRKAEDYAAAWLESQGWEALAQRVKTPVGEIDLVMRRQALVAFVEVKYRKRAEELDFAIDERRLSRVAAAAEVAAPDYLQAGDDMRIDVVLLAPHTPPRHIENAWQP
jgi:putative endonuclease